MADLSIVPQRIRCDGDHPWAVWSAERFLWLALSLTSALATVGPAMASGPAAGAVTESLSVAKCVELARTQAPEVRAVASAREAARLDSIATSLNGRPAFSVFGGTTIAPPGFYDPAMTNLGEYEIKTGLELPLKDGGNRRRERQRSALQARNATIDLARASRDAGLRAAEVALDLLRSREQAAGLEATLAWLERLDVLVTSGVRAGTRDRSDAERARLESDAVRSDLETLAQSRITLGRELAELTGLAPGTPSVREFAPEDLMTHAQPDSLAALERAAAAPEVRAAEVAVSQQQVALDEARHKNAFTLDLAADAGVWGGDVSHLVPPDFAVTHPGATFADRLRRDLGASVGVRFKRPILDPAARYSVVAREQELRAAQLRAAAALAARTRTALDALTKWQAAARRLALADSSATQAEDHLLRLRSLYAAGSSSLLELLDARRQLDDVRGRRADARMESRLARWQEVLQ